ncbi:MAG: GNAT family N-acetyltransferase, partial [Candidatus Bathyarchaeota archaeon]
MEFKIRTRETEEDAEFFQRLNFESYRLTMLRGQEISEDEARARFEEFEKADPLDPWGDDHQAFFVEDEKGSLAGLIWLADREPFWRFKERLAWIYNLHILPEFRRRGLARRFLA